MFDDVLVLRVENDTDYYVRIGGSFITSFLFFCLYEANLPRGISVRRYAATVNCQCYRSELYCSARYINE